MPQEENQAQRPADEESLDQEAGAGEAGGSAESGPAADESPPAAVEAVVPEETSLPGDTDEPSEAGVEWPDVGADAVEDDEEEDHEHEAEKPLGVEVEIEEPSPTSRRLTGRVPAARIAEIYDEYWGELSESVQLRGFRKGRVPRRLLARRVGEHLHEEMVKNMKQQVLAEVSKDYGLYMVGEPEFARADLAEGEPFEFEVTCSVVPDFAIPPFDDIEVAREDAVVAEEDIDAEIERRRAQHAQLATVEEWPPKEGDELIVAARIRTGPRLFRQAEAHSLRVGAREFMGLLIPGLPAKLTAGDRQLSFEVSVPEEHPNEKLRARRVTVEIDIQEVKRPAMPDVTDEWAGLFDCESVDALRKKIEEELLAQRRQAEDAGLGRRAFEQILKRVDIQVPEEVTNRLLGDEAETAEAAPGGDAEGAETPADDEADAPAPEEVAAEAATEKARAVTVERTQEVFRRRVLLDRIAEAEKLEVSDEEVEAYLGAMEGVSGKALTALKQRLAAEGILDDLARQLLTFKVYDHLQKHCRIAGAEAGSEATAGETPATAGEESVQTGGDESQEEKA